MHKSTGVSGKELGVGYRRELVGEAEEVETGDQEEGPERMEEKAISEGTGAERVWKLGDGSSGSGSAEDSLDRVEFCNRIWNVAQDQWEGRNL